MAKRNNKDMKKIIILLVLFSNYSLVALAAEETQHKVQVSEPEAAASLTDGVLKKVNMAQGTLIIQHEEIKNLDMPPMTMLFNVKDPSLMAGLKAGDHIQFKAIDSKGALIVTWIRVK